MYEDIPGLDALLTWSRETLAGHGARCVCAGCLALVRAEAGLEEIRVLLARRDARRQHEERQQRFRFIEVPDASR
jgi:hypothetical protein